MDSELAELSAVIKRWQELFRSRPAPPPFNNPAADTILRSSGALPMDFRVHRVIMTEASEVFADMFAIPQPPRPKGGADDGDDYVGDTPVVRLTEDAQTLLGFLRLCYPVADPDLRTPYEIRPVLEAAMKYEMVEATALMKNALRARTEDRALGVWGAACSLGLEQEANAAALVLARVGYTPHLFSEADDVAHVSAGQYFRLLKYIASGGQVDDKFSFWHASPGDAIPPAASAGAQSHPADSAVTLQERDFADVVCRASDGVELFTHKAILSAVSPLLRARIVALNIRSQSPSATLDGVLPVLEFDEASPVLSALLELCYPVRRSAATDLPLSLQHICAVTKAATKYDMGFVLDHLDGAFHAQCHRNVLSAFLLASHAGLDDYAYSAERALLCGGRAPATYGWLPEMEVIAAPAYHDLLAKHNAVARHGISYYDRHLGSPRKRQHTEGA